MFSGKRMLLCSIIITVLVLMSGCFKLDTDRDGIADGIDNCVDTPNADQADDDNDGIGNLCDNCPSTTFLRFSEQRDSDEDGIGDVCDNCINVKNPDQLDNNSDGIGDACAEEADMHRYELLAKASPDECFYGVGEANEYDPTGFDLQTCLSADGVPKRNEGYIWGMTKAGNNIFFGTNANVVCNNSLSAHPYDTSNLWVCERSEENNTNPLAVWDLRPPSMYMYNNTNETSKKLVRLSVNPGDETLVYDTIGLRSAANHDGVVFIAGPASVDLTAGVNMFAFDAGTGDPLGAYTLPYANIRHWLVVNDTLYCGVGSVKSGGAVLKWTGSRSDPFQFEVIGQNIGNDVDYLCVHDNRIFVTTWPSVGLELLDPENIPGSGKEAAVWMSPAFTDTLDSDSADKWEKVWSIFDYEADPLCALFTGGGPIMSYGGWLYWSTMHGKNQAQGYLLLNGLKMTYAERQYTQEGGYRSIAIFRGRNLDSETGKTVEVLYGEEYLDTFSAETGWTKVPNNMDADHRKPVYGHSGFGNRANNYTWTMQVYDGKLYVGTMDELGADLYCFPDVDSPAAPVSIYGLGNIANHGIRTMLADDDGYLYMGTANHYSMSTYSADELISLSPDFARFEDTSIFSNFDAVGGWELIRLHIE